MNLGRKVLETQPSYVRSPWSRSFGFIFSFRRTVSYDGSFFLNVSTNDKTAWQWLKLRNFYRAIKYDGAPGSRRKQNGLCLARFLFIQLCLYWCLKNHHELLCGLSDTIKVTLSRGRIEQEMKRTKVYILVQYPLSFSYVVMQWYIRFLPGWSGAEMRERDAYFLFTVLSMLLCPNGQ